MSGNSVWEQVLARAKARNRFTFAAWFEPIRVISDDGIAVQVSVPNELFHAWFLEQYARLVEEILGEIGRKDVRVSYVVDPERRRRPTA